MLGRSSFRALALAAGAFISVVACGGAESGGQSAAAPIEIGVIQDLTGANTTFGKAYYQVIKLVFDDVNAHGGINGHKINAHYEDDASDAAQGVAAARKLIDRDGVKLIYGGTFTPVALAIAKIADQENVFFYTPASTAPALTDPVRKYVFAANANSDASARGIVSLTASMKPKKIGFVQETDAYGQQGLDGVKRYLASAGLSVDTVVTIAANANDATSQVVKLRDAKVDLVIQSVTINPATAMIKAMHQQGVNIPLLSFGGGAAPAIDQMLASSAPVEYYAVTPLGCPLPDGACVKSFMDVFHKAYPNDNPSVWSAQGYAATQQFVAALKAAKGYSPQEVATAMESMKGYQSPLIPFPIKYSADSHLGVQNVYLYGFKDGKLYFFGNDLAKNTLKK